MSSARALLALAAVRGEVLECASTTVACEDYWEPKHIALCYGICRTKAGNRYISAESAHLNALMPGGKATLRLRLAVSAADNRRAKLSAERADVPMPLYPYIRTPADLFEIDEVIQASSPPTRQARAATDVHSVVTIRLVRNNVHVEREGLFWRKHPQPLTPQSV